MSNSFCFASFAASSQEFSLLGHLGVRHLSTPSSRVASGLDQDPWTASLAHGFLLSGSKRTLSTWPVLDLVAPSAALLLTNASLATDFSTLAVRPAMSCASLVPLVRNLYLKFGLSGLTFLFACRSTCVALVLQVGSLVMDHLFTLRLAVPFRRHSPTMCKVGHRCVPSTVHASQLGGFRFRSRIQHAPYSAYLQVLWHFFQLL